MFCQDLCPWLLPLARQGKEGHLLDRALVAIVNHLGCQKGQRNEEEDDERRDGHLRVEPRPPTLKHSRSRMVFGRGCGRGVSRRKSVVKRSEGSVRVLYPNESQMSKSQTHAALNSGLRG